MARVPLPGGCQIGARPVVEHVKVSNPRRPGHIEHGWSQLSYRAGIASPAARSTGLPQRGRHRNLDDGRRLADGETTIENAAQEPEVVDLAGLIIAMGGKVRELAPPITIVGMERLHGADYMVIPDRIEAGTLLLAGAITRSKLRITLIPEHLGAVLSKLEEAGCTLESDGIGMTISADRCAPLICAPSRSLVSPPTCRPPS